MTDNLLNADIPKKFKDPQTGAVRVGDLAKSYSELEKKLSTQPAAPKSADEYCVKCDHGMFSEDKELNARFHEKGFTNEQVQFVYDLAAEKMVPMIVEMAADYQADRELEKLIAQFGGEEKWKEVSRQLLAFGQKSLPADVLETLSSSHEGVMALYRMMKGDGPAIGKNPAEMSGGNPAELELQSMMRDPKYWRDQDPSFIAKVSEGFKNLYSGQ